MLNVTLSMPELSSILIMVGSGVLSFFSDTTISTILCMLMRCMARLWPVICRITCLTSASSCCNGFSPSAMPSFIILSIRLQSMTTRLSPEGFSGTFSGSDWLPISKMPSPSFFLKASVTFLDLSLAVRWAYILSNIWVSSWPVAIIISSLGTPRRHMIVENVCRAEWV